MENSFTLDGFRQVCMMRDDAHWKKLGCYPRKVNGRSEAVFCRVESFGVPDLFLLFESLQGSVNIPSCLWFVFWVEFQDDLARREWSEKSKSIHY